MKVTTKQEVVQTLKLNSIQIKSMGVSSIGLFGSFVRNEMNDGSDVDLFVEFEPGKKSYSNYIKLAYYLEDLMGRKTELLTKAGLSKYIGSKILKSIEYVPLTT